jgi:hypothetical protein
MLTSPHRGQVVAAVELVKAGKPTATPQLSVKRNKIQPENLLLRTCLDWIAEKIYGTSSDFIQLTLKSLPGQNPCIVVSHCTII